MFNAIDSGSSYTEGERLTYNQWNKENKGTVFPITQKVEAFVINNDYDTIQVILEEFRLDFRPQHQVYNYLKSLSFIAPMHELSIAFCFKSPKSKNFNLCIDDEEYCEWKQLGDSYFATTRDVFEALEPDFKDVQYSTYAQGVEKIAQIPAVLERERKVSKKPKLNKTSKKGKTSKVRSEKDDSNSSVTEKDAVA